MVRLEEDTGNNFLKLFIDGDFVTLIAEVQRDLNPITTLLFLYRDRHFFYSIPRMFLAYYHFDKIERIEWTLWIPLNFARPRRRYQANYSQLLMI